jgi:hypothetical protein
VKEWLDSLSAKRRHLMEAVRANDCEQGIIGSVADRYADPTHFVFELLQNADDQTATNVSFVFEQDRLTFWHDGEPFSREDVEAITRIGNSHKAKKANKIGRYGIGFKSVFKVTERPIVGCELEGRPFAFAIEDLVVPVPLTSDEVPREPGTTIFDLPFRHGLSAEKRQAIMETISGLGPPTLLFLNHIEQVFWRSGSKSGECSCDRSERSLRVFRQSGPSHENDVTTRYMLLTRTMTLEASDRPEQVVSMAFRLDDAGQIITEPVATPLHVFFETSESTGFLFRIHGPFLLTDNRANIKLKEPTNELLASECGKLLVESIRCLKAQGRLNSSTLAVLPNADDVLAEWCRPLRTAVIGAMREESLVPCANGGFEAARHLVRGPELIQSVVKDADLKFLKSSETAGWSVGVAEGSRSEKFLESLGVARWGWQQLLEALGRRFDPGCQSREGEVWLSRHDDKWMTGFYALLRSATERQQFGFSMERLRQWPIVRTRDGRHLKAAGVFFPGEAAVGALDGVNLLKPELLGGDDGQLRRVRAFLSSIGVREVGRKEKVIALLNAYYAPGKTCGSLEAHLEHIKRFLEYVQKTGDTSVFKERAVFVDKSERSLIPGHKCYIDEPIQRTGLASVYSVLKTRRGLWDDYTQFKDKGFVAFAISLGVIDKLEVVLVPIKSNPAYPSLTTYASPTRTTEYEESRDYNIESLDPLLRAKDRAVSRCIWDTMCNAPGHVLTATYRANRTVDENTAPSTLVWSLQRTAWVPGRDNAFRKPEQMTRDDLPDDFPFKDRSGWLDAVEFGKLARLSQEESKRSESQRAIEVENRRKAAEDLGVPPELVAFLDRLRPKDRPRVVTEMMNLWREDQKPPKFPERTVQDPEGRAKQIAEEARSAPRRIRDVRERTVIVAGREEHREAKNYLRALYTCSDSQMLCQICQQVMPFRLADGHYYFEAVAFDGRESKEHVPNHLALCPTCAAKYMHARWTPESDLRRLLGNDGLIVSLILAQKEEAIRFVEMHKHDLRVLFSALSKQVK